MRVQKYSSSLDLLCINLAEIGWISPGWEGARTADDDADQGEDDDPVDEVHGAAAARAQVGAAHWL